MYKENVQMSFQLCYQSAPDFVFSSRFGINSIMCRCHRFFVHSSVLEHLDCFQVLSIVTIAAMNTGVQISF